MIVIDASITLSWFFADEALPARRAVLERVLAEGATAPHQWLMEAANVLVMGRRRERLDDAGLAASLAAIMSLPVHTESNSVDVVQAAVELAERRKLTVYDAAYLELARRRKLPLATLDEELAVAARAEGVAVLPSAASAR